ncbi:MAG: glycine cleavage system protein GcvH [Planctomycetes bacterium]|nr:glycine cleavage system protein GcvH [Planctomycetota bacterium]
MNPNDRRYAESHEWARAEGNTVTIGITQHAVDELTDLVYIELPEVGAEVTAGQAFGEIESVKAVSELVSPVDGKVVEVNTDLNDDLDPISKDSYQSGWMVKIEATDLSQLDSLMTAEEYEKKTESESS